MAGHSKFKNIMHRKGAQVLLMGCIGVLERKRRPTAKKSRLVVLLALDTQKRRVSRYPTTATMRSQLCLVTLAFVP